MKYEALKIIGPIVLVLVGVALLALIQYRNNQKDEAKFILLCTFGPFGLALLSLAMMGIIQNFISEEFARPIFVPIFAVMIILFVFVIKKIDKNGTVPQKTNEQ